jgi:hypothetical protein
MPGVEREVATIHVTLDLLIDRWFDDFTYWKWWYSIAAIAMECAPIHVVTQDGIQPLDWCGQRQEPCFLKGALPCFTHLYPPLPIFTHQAKGSPKLI